MPRERTRPPAFETVNIWAFAQASLGEVQESAHAKGMPRPIRDDVASAAVWAMAQLPAEVCKAMIEAYIAAEKDAHDAICRGLEALFRV